MTNADNRRLDLLVLEDITKALSHDTSDTEIVQGPRSMFSRRSTTKVLSFTNEQSRLVPRFLVEAEIGLFGTRLDIVSNRPEECGSETGPE